MTVRILVWGKCLEKGKNSEKYSNLNISNFGLKIYINKRLWLKLPSVSTDGRENKKKKLMGFSPMTV